MTLTCVYDFLFVLILLVCKQNASAGGEDMAGSQFRSFRTKELIDLRINMKDGGSEILVAGKPWFSLQGGLALLGLGPMQLDSTMIISDLDDPLFGTYDQITFSWSSSDQDMNVVKTSFLLFHKHDFIIFDQYFEDGWEKEAALKRDVQSTILPFPSISTNLLDETLSFMTWGECFLGETRSGKWSELTHDDYVSLFDGDIFGQPLLLHDSSGQTVVWSSLSNFFVSSFAVSSNNQTIEVGLRSTLKSIPSDFHHTSIMSAGMGINATLVEWGDVLLKNGGGKKRTNVYDDFVLSHLGYWTDNGAYHYHGAHDHYPNMEEALLDVKVILNKTGVPIRYVQWDDWWMESRGDIPGMLSWTPKEDVFPSGFTDWLGMPLAMYAPEYSGENVWIHDYTWKTHNTSRGATAIPLDKRFYQDLFRNGTAIGMKIFEQDFLCSYGIGDSGLTSTDVYSGTQWFQNLDDAAVSYGVTVQLCMANAYHLLHSTTMRSVTNIRATGDNTRDWQSVHSMGQNGLLFHAVGVFAPRDNVWTSNPGIEQQGCGNKDFCFEPNAHLNNAVAVLSGGPYGIADAAPHVNKTVAMYCCRSDGLILRPKLQLASLDFTFLEPDAIGARIWGAHDEHGGFRWCYLVGVNIDRDVKIHTYHLSQNAAENNNEMIAWEVEIGRKPDLFLQFSDTEPLRFPKSKPLDLPYEDVHWSIHTHMAAAPVLTNGMVFLGELNKWAGMSFGRIARLSVDLVGLSIEAIGAPRESVIFSYLKSSDESVAHEVVCQFPSTCEELNLHDDPVCRMNITCRRESGCECTVDETSTYLRTS